MHTTPISGAAIALKASPAPSANSSLADFLLADASENAGLDFRTIAATLFGVAGSTADKTIEPAKDSTATKKPSASVPRDASDDREDKKLSDPASLLSMHPELTAPIVIPEVMVQVSPKQGDLAEEERAKTTAAAATTPLTGTAGPNARLQIERDEIANKVAGNESLDAITAQAENASIATSLPELDQPNSKPSAAAALGLLNEMPTGEHALQPGRKATAEIAAPSPTSGKKSSDPTKFASDRTAAFGLAEPVKHDSPAAPNIKASTPPSDTTATAGKNDLPRPAATDAVPVAPPVNPISNASAKEIAESHMATKAASQAKALDPALASESRNVVEHSPASELAKVKDRSSARDKDRVGKDRGKDTRTGSTDSGKLAPTQAGRAVAGTTNFGGNSGKDSGMGSPNNSAAQAKQGLVKQSTGSSSSPAVAAETDGPDEALPITTSSPITAKFVQGMSGSEFRVGMQSQEFGNIDIRTSVARHMFSAQISVEHSGVAKSLATELPALYSKLADQHVAVANIVIQGQSLGASSSFAQDAQQQQGWRPQQSHGSASSNSEAILPAMVEALDSQGRLDIRI